MMDTLKMTLELRYEDGQVRCAAFMFRGEEASCFLF